MFNGKMKAVTFSYDDCTTQDIKLAELFNKYNVKATFNVNSELLGTENELIRKGVNVRHDKLSADEIKKVYEDQTCEDLYYNTIYERQCFEQFMEMI